MSLSVQLLKSEKRALFKSRLQQLKHKKPGFNSTNSSADFLATNLLSLNIWGQNPIVASYRAMKEEISPFVFEQKMGPKTRFVFPQLRGKEMVFLPPQKGGVKPKPQGAFDPASHQNLKPGPKIDIFLVPGLAFDREGHRLGRGGGFYDRFLAQSKALKIGLAHHFQISNSPLPLESHDISMDVVVTDKYFFIPINKAKDLKKTDFFNKRLIN